ncbi:MAG: glycosyltransferase family 2 protein [Candidatus Omnitrophica bacterium]|nr:glycosyltransferase family 2 protein [Candidatus Omnitrophota bacterium]
MKVVFWISLAWVFYSYAGYMLFLFLATAFKREDVARDGALPFVSMIIAAFNEKKCIGDKIRNCFGIDYPAEKFEVIIVSDSSTDGTDEIVTGFGDKRIKFIRMNERKGKTAAQNSAVRLAKGDILVFSDATTVYKNDAVRMLVGNFGDPKVGIAAGEEILVRKKGSNVYNEVSFSWKYERLLRRLESRFNTLIGVSGCIFAIRKELYEKLDEGLIEDFALPILIAEKGYKARLEKRAVAYEEPVNDPKEEFDRKARIVRGGINVLVRLRRTLDPRKDPKLAFQLISHKVFRWMTPFFLVTLLAANAASRGKGAVYDMALAAQIAMYLFAALGYLMRYSSARIRIFNIAFHFCVLNAAAAAGIYKFLKGEREARWEPIR